MPGKLTIICGPMFSGKTTELIRRINRARSIGSKVFVVHNQRDTRYGENYICTHLQNKIASNPCQNLNELINNSEYKEADILVIEEAQFFDQLYDFVVDQVDNYDKHIILSGLDGDYQRQPFRCNGNMDLLRLIPMSDKIIKLTAYCHQCLDETPAIFTHLVKVKKNLDEIKENNGIILGGLDKFKALCRKHYLEVNSVDE
jgi:thymidine kinase